MASNKGNFDIIKLLLSIDKIDINIKCANDISIYNHF